MAKLWLIIQWNLSWETTALRDKLSWATTILAKGPTFQYNWTCYQRPPVLSKVRDHILVANGMVFQDRFHCTDWYHTYDRDYLFPSSLWVYWEYPPWKSGWPVPFLCEATSDRHLHHGSLQFQHSPAHCNKELYIWESNIYMRLRIHVIEEENSYFSVSLKYPGTIFG